MTFKTYCRVHYVNIPQASIKPTPCFGRLSAYMQPIQLQNHLWWRAAFGPTPSQATLSKLSTARQWDALWQASAAAPAPLQAIDGPAQEALRRMAANMMQANADNAEQAALRRQVQQRNRQAARQLNVLWLQQMISSEAQLREKMAFFWHSHFACRNNNTFFQQQLLHVLRTHALGNFGTLLQEVSKSAAMLQFLNNQQNRKNSPNENFAREVMELFTLGRGHYTEQDVKQVARAFTGWSYDAEGNYRLRPALHDAGSKTIFGKTGNYTGDDVLQMLLERKETAYHICRKLYRFFVNENINEGHVKQLAEGFFASGYAIAPLLQQMFTAKWFYDAKNVGTRIKSPVELWVGLRRQLPMQLKNEEVVLVLQNALGQVLMMPPNVAGWPGGKAWIDSSSLLLRMQLPLLLLRAEGVQLALKPDDDTDMGQARSSDRILNRFRIEATPDWPTALTPFGQAKHGPYRAMAPALLQAATLPPEDWVRKLLPEPNNPRHIMAGLLALPEYQLC